MNFIVHNENATRCLKFEEISISPKEENGYRPYELFISSLIGCSGTLLRNILMKKRDPFKSIEVTASSVTNKANRIEQVSIVAHMYIDELTTTHQAEKVAQLVVKNCDMIQSVPQAMEIDFTIAILSINGESN
ncbi:OsmC family protein [Priestia filamentosa]|uniref:OsmC family protein n=1 Tax=Priestia filamentosa TaxID=1402861 RepID=UPI003F18794F